MYQQSAIKSVATVTAMSVVLVTFIATILTAATIPTIVATTFIAHVVAKCGATAATYRRAHQAAGIAANAAAQNVTACCAQTTADSGFCTITTIGTDRATSCTANASANR